MLEVVFFFKRLQWVCFCGVFERFFDQHSQTPSSLAVLETKPEHHSVSQGSLFGFDFRSLNDGRVFFHFRIDKFNKIGSGDGAWCQPFILKFFDDTWVT